ncbi:subtilisin-like protease SUB2 [Myriangium duriaei CBS 260.36]|uniref:Subtilisin-like protease SUB2 n=1 Tax=Myriangium duriaei CBS 260.36 TaxID=1168546 RepID=A0A9P4MJ99_9PEZI|nr:subtilisin-like protease SUB2 [Myriangium duriaei CBS 260.36]
MHSPKFRGVLVASLLGVNLTASSSQTLPSPALDISDRYIVTLKPNIDLTQHLNFIQALHQKTFANEEGGALFEGLSHNWTIQSFKAYAGHFPPAIVEQLEAHQDVANVEADQIINTAGLVIQKDTAYNLNFISHKSIDASNSGYVYDSSAGADTFAYVIDTGIDTAHKEFQGRAIFGYNALKDKDNRDYPGHGTKVAGIIGSKTYGVAKKCHLVAVKVFDGRRGVATHVIDGYNWAYHDIIRKDLEAVAVISMSVDGGDYSKALNDAIDSASKEGVLTVVAAGNHGQDVSKVWTTKSAIIVGGTGKTRTAVPQSNYGKSVTLFAPGVDIPTTGLQNSVTSFSGTSASAPHVSGLLLYFMGQRRMTSTAAKKKLIQVALKNVVKSTRGSPNLFAYNDSGK